MYSYFLVFIGGGMGSISRYAIGKVVKDNFQNINPLGTFAANIISTIILGVLMYFFVSRNSIDSNLKLFIATGFCGGFSTFSTFGYETIELFRQGYNIIAIANIVFSVLAAILILFLISKLA